MAYHAVLDEKHAQPLHGGCPVIHVGPVLLFSVFSLQLLRLCECVGFALAGPPALLGWCLDHSAFRGCRRFVRCALLRTACTRPKCDSLPRAPDIQVFCCAGLLIDACSVSM